MTFLNLWDGIPGSTEGGLPRFSYYEPSGDAKDAAVVIFPGGGYVGLAEHEGRGYAEFLSAAGYHAFVCEYRVKTDDTPIFPLPLLDARRAVTWVRSHAKEYGIDPHKVAAMGSSAGGHLTAMLSTFTGSLDGSEGGDYLPDASIICYGVTDEPLDDVIRECYDNLMGSGVWKDNSVLTPAKTVGPHTPPAFLWHTSDDPVVNVLYCYRYATALRQNGIPHEVHVFPHGSHGLGLATGNPSVGQWGGLLLRWLSESLGW